MRFAIISVVVNIVTSFTLSHYLGHLGIAMGTTIAAWLNALQLGVTLGRRGHFASDDRLKARWPRIVISALVMGAVLLGAHRMLGGNYTEGAGFVAALWGLVLLVVLGITSYFLVAHVSGAMKIGELMSMLRRREQAKNDDKAS